jgi:hypothetical protein
MLEGMLMGLNISRIVFAAVLIATFMVGALLSYLWIVGYYESLELKSPRKPAISIENFIVSPEDPTFFNISILNPSFSPDRVKVAGISVLTEDRLIHDVIISSPKIPSEGYILEVGSSETFKCSWNWAKYTGQSATVIVFVKDGSGGTISVTLPLVEIKITSLTFNPEDGHHFNVTIENSSKSSAGVNLMNIKVIVDNSTNNIKTIPQLPARLEPAHSASFICEWDWADHQNRTIKVVAETSQGFIAEKTYNVPLYAFLSIEDVKFNPADTDHINVTLLNSEKSLISLNIAGIELAFENGTTITLTRIEPGLPRMININERLTFMCEWSWIAHRGEEIVIIVLTEQGYKVRGAYKVPS